MFNTPILFLTYKRPQETNNILNILLRINPSKLYIFQDGFKKKFSKSEMLNHLETKEQIELAERLLLKRKLEIGLIEREK